MGVQPVGVAGGLARPQRAKALADFAVLDAALHREQGLRRVVAQRGRKRDLIFGGETRGLEIRRAEFLQQMAGEALDHAWRSASVASVTMASVDQPKLSMPRKPERSATRCFWPSVAGSSVPEHERAGYRPFAGFRRALENEGVRRVEPDGSRQFQHVRLIRVSDRAPADHTRRPCASASTRLVRSGGPLPAGGPHQQVAVDVDGAALAGLADRQAAPDNPVRSPRTRVRSIGRTRSSDGAQNFR